MSVRVGPVDLLESLPASVDVKGEQYIIADSDPPVLFSSECPHMGGTVEVVDDDCLRCPQHGWEFSPDTGDATGVPNESLTTYELSSKEGYLYAELPEPDTRLQFTVDDPSSAPPNIELLSHATLRITYQDYTLVTDPWLDGPAFTDAWTQYPPPTCDIDSIVDDTDAIWITHEHPDHLNPRTLEHFDPKTPVYVPELNYRRLSSRLHDLGFKHVHALPTETPYKLADGVEAACFESNSTWNDSILALNCGGFTIINVNDAGVNWRVNRAIPTADLVATGFAFGASGYPLTWEHLDEEAKQKMIDDRNEGHLQKCEQLVEMFDADYLLPFAKFFTLVSPEHAEYRRLMEQNRPRDVADRLADHSVRVLDLLPGESWAGDSEDITRRDRRDEFYDPEFREHYLDEINRDLEPTVTNEFTLTHSKLEDYFTAMAGSKLAASIEDFALSLDLTGDNRHLSALIRFQTGDITYEATDDVVELGTVDASHHVKMQCPGRIVQHVIEHDRSWDDIHIGYWCTFDREPDEYCLGFWRLLHAPWEARNDTVRIADAYDFSTVLEDVPMADLVESNQEVASVLASYGLHCVGCPEGLGEDILEAARMHGLSPEQARQLVVDVESVAEKSAEVTSD